MPKTNAYSRNNVFDTLGLLDVLNAYTDQPVLTTSDVSFNTITGTFASLTGDLVIGGDLTVNGSTTIISSTTVEIEDNIILLNSEQTDPGVTLNLSGIEIERGNLTNFQVVYEESTKLFKIGNVGTLQAVATRDDTPLNKGIMTFNETTKKLISVADIELPISFSSGTVSTSPTTGSIVIDNGGGLGVTGSIYLDDTLYFNNSNFITRAISNNFIINSGNNFLFQQPVNTEIKVPTDVNLTFSTSTKKIHSDGTHLYITNSGGNLNLDTSGNVILHSNKYLQWVNNSNTFGFNGTNMILNSSGNFTISPIVVIQDTTPSTSNSNGSLITAGGVGIFNTTDSISELNGGTITTAGGVGIAKKLFVGKEITSNNGTNNDHFRLFNDGLNRFSLGLSGLESGANIGSDFVINRYNDAGVFIDKSINIERDTGDIVIPSTSLESLKLFGGINILNTTDATSATVGGTFTTSGGVGISKKLFVGTDFYVSNNAFITGISNLNQTNIDTTDGVFSVQGVNSVDISVGNSSNFSTTAGSLSLESNSGTVIVSGNSGINLNSNSGTVITSGAQSSFSTSVGKIIISGQGLDLSGVNNQVNVSTTANVSINSGAGGVVIDTTDTANGIKIGTNLTSVPVYIGHTSSEVVINDNLTVGGDFTILGTTTSINSSVLNINDNSIIVNSLPSGLSDGGYLVKRYQTPNNTGSGRIVLDTPLESSSFQAGSSSPETLVLNNSSSNVDNFYNGMWILITSGAGQNQVRRIKDYTASTNIAILYTTVDNDSSFQDGLDLTTSPLTGDTYSIFDCSFASIFYSEVNKEIRLACIPLNTSSGEFPTPEKYIPLHAGGLILEGGFQTNAVMLIDNTDEEAFLVRKSSDTGDVFKIDTLNGKVILANPVNTINSSIPILFQQLDTVNNPQTYSEISSVITNNVAGNLRNDLDFKVQKDTNGLTTFLTLSGSATGNSFVEFSSAVDILRILNTSQSVNSSSASVVVSGGISISNTQNATSYTNGGTFTTAGGATIEKDLYIGGNLNISGNINAGVSTEAITVFNTVNINNGTVSVINSKLISNSTERFLSVTFRFNPSSNFTTSSFDFSVPDVISFLNIYDAVGSVNGYSNDANPKSLENAIVFCLTTTDRVRVKTTSDIAIDDHTLNVMLRYTV